MSAAPTVVVSAVPTVVIPQGTPITVPTLTLPKATPTPTPKPRHRAVHRAPPPPKQSWILAFLTSYCPGSAGWISASGSSVFYGMLANDYYPFGTHVYIPSLGMTGVVEDRFGGYIEWNHFDVWSPVCYSTPTGWFKAAILG